MTKWQLFSAMVSGTQIVVSVSNGKGGSVCRYGRVMAIQLEDGSGSCFNVTLRDLGDDINDNIDRTVFVRTID